MKPLTAREHAQFLIRQLFFDRFGDVPYEPSRLLDNHRLKTIIETLGHLAMDAEEQTLAMRQYMNLWDDPTYEGLARYLTPLIVRYGMA